MNKHPSDDLFRADGAENEGENLSRPASDKSLNSTPGNINEIINIPDDDEKIMIECPGATLYDQSGHKVVAGVKFVDSEDPGQGFEIVDRPVYGPQHVRYRRVNREDAHLLRRCQSCQDYTVRMRRKEGPDLYIPSRKNPSPRNRRRSARQSIENSPENPFR